MFDTGNTSFMLVASALVLLMTPGLALFYGGLVGKKNVITIMMQSFVSMALTTMLWFVVGYTMCFSGDYTSGTDIGGIIGNFNLAFLHGITPMTASPVNPTIPITAFIAYQLMSAIITPALITGAFANRVRFSAYLIFLVVWMLFVYFPFIHMVWGGGIMAAWGVKDFGGGIVVHNVAGFAALGSVLYIGKRKARDAGMHNLPLFALGTGLLWFGWFGFNAGAEFSANGISSQAFINTQVSASFAAMTWLFISWWLEKKPKMVGFLTGVLAGLVTITPAAGFVSTKAAVAIGVLSGIICYFAIALKNKFKWDDALDVWGIHGIGGFTGIILLGVFGWTAINEVGSNGLFHGGSSFFGLQVLAVAISSAYSLVITYILLLVINLFTPVAVTKEVEERGLDFELHGEDAYLEEEPAIAPIGGKKKISVN